MGGGGGALSLMDHCWLRVSVKPSLFQQHACTNLSILRNLLGMETLSTKWGRESFRRGIIPGHPHCGMRIIVQCRRVVALETCFDQRRNRLILPRSSRGHHPGMASRSVNLVLPARYPPLVFG